MKPKIAIVLRGHVRNSLNDSRLNDFLKELLNYLEFDLYIQSWNRIDASKTWTNGRRGGKRSKGIIDINQTITSDSILSYFESSVTDRIQCLKILNEDTINLFGKLDGNVGQSACPLISWKRMWCGVNEVVSEVNEDKYPFIVNTRFDILDESLVKFCGGKNPSTRPLLSHHDFIRKITFQRNLPQQNTMYSLYYKIGCDNFYASGVWFMKKIVYELHKNLDEILREVKEQNITMKNQEAIFKYYSEREGNFRHLI